MPLRVVFMGTPDFAVAALMQIVGAGHQVVACYTQPPRKADRGMESRKSPVHKMAESFQIPVHTPTTLKDSIAQSIFKSHKADAGIDDR